MKGKIILNQVDGRNLAAVLDRLILVASPIAQDPSNLFFANIALQKIYCSRSLLCFFNSAQKGRLGYGAVTTAPFNAPSRRYR